MPAHSRAACISRAALLASAVSLAGCSDFDIDLRNNGANTSAAAQQATADLPRPDDRGVISYPTYQVAVARRGDTVADVAARVGVDSAALAQHNAMEPTTSLRDGEIIALHTRVAEPSPATGSPTTGPIQSPDVIDITTLAGGAIDRASTGQPAVATTAEGTKVAVAPEPVRHQVQRGETAYSISRIYGVSVSALAEWNGLGPELSLREGQYLLIPITGDTAPTNADETSPPGGSSVLAAPPSAATPLPADEAARTTPVDLPASPDLGSDATVSSELAMPVNGPIIRGFKKKSNDGIDISASAGSTVKAAEAGTVAAITRDTDQVPILVIRHTDSLMTVYANIDSITVEKGDSVTRGQTIAKVRAGDPAFVHFEVREGFESVDPLPYLE
ncbi:peptidase M23B [Actibacterium atlanticum]|uniref:Peptidase M23B n=1 Tax=Actibacterium atlanticum TaxID=1461693 RepID=A0A058ZNS3_9RHOB|nr:peptidoglycan DD-metalloendopeptidase family protein [Actibacterium atlanticum]KCV83203.1 peptidase M23B [Actibacterium atlanticum]